MKLAIVVAVAFVAGILGGVLGQSIAWSSRPVRGQDLVRARRFELLDPKGNVVSYWGIDRRDYAVLAFGSYWPSRTSEKAVSRRADSVSLGVIDDYPFLEMNSVNGSSRISLGLSIFDKPLLTMGDDSGTRLGLGVSHSDTPSAADEDWLLRFEPDRARLGMVTRTERGQKYVQGISGVYTDKIKAPSVSQAK